MVTTIYNGLLYTTKEINRNFRIKINYKPARRNKIKYNCQIVGYGADGKECVRFDNYIDAEKRGMYRHLIKKSVDTGKPYKGILYKEEK